MSLSKPVFSREDILRGIRKSRDAYREMAAKADPNGLLCYNTRDRWEHMVHAYDDILALYAERDEK